MFSEFFMMVSINSELRQTVSVLCRIIKSVQIIRVQNETKRTMNENYIDIELGGWNIPEAITVEAEPVEARDFSDFEL